eukprot:1296987-Prymnesium_polylepis.1
MQQWFELFEPKYTWRPPVSTCVSPVAAPPDHITHTLPEIAGWSAYCNPTHWDTTWVGAVRAEVTGLQVTCNL